MDAAQEVPLEGGNASAAVVRVGETVRKPWLPTSARTVEYMEALRAKGVDLPASHGREPDVVCHNDLAPWNLIVDGDRLVFIDWDGAGPSTRLWDLAYAAVAFGHLFPGADVDEAAARLTAFVDGYGADQDLRDALPRAMADRAEAMHELLRRSHESGREPWGSMYSGGHGEHWSGTVDFVRLHEDVWARAVGAGRVTWRVTTHDWSRDVDVEHLVVARERAESLGADLPLHLVLEVIAYADDEAAATGRRGDVAVSIRGDEVTIADDGRGTDTRRDAWGRPVRKPVMATRDVRFFDVDDAPLLPDGLPRRGMSAVAAATPLLVHENHRREGAWRQTYRHGVPDSELQEIPRATAPVRRSPFVSRRPDPSMWRDCERWFASSPTSWCTWCTWCTWWWPEAQATDTGQQPHMSSIDQTHTGCLNHLSPYRITAIASGECWKG